MIIDKFAIEKLKNKLIYDEQAHVLRKVLKQPEELLCFDDALHLFHELNINNLSFIDRDHKKSMIIPSNNIVNEETKKDLVNECLRKYENNETINIIDVESILPKVKTLVDELLKIFVDPLAKEGIYDENLLTDPSFPVATAHLYMGKKESQSFYPHQDIPNNFIFMISGTAKVQIFDNKGSQLLSPINFTEIHNKRFFHTIEHDLRPLFETILEPGDMIYIPSRQVHYFEPLEERMSLSIPMMGKSGYMIYDKYIHPEFEVRGETEWKK